MKTAHQILAEMARLPVQLLPDLGRCVLEATDESTIAPFLEFERLTDIAWKAHLAWAESQGAEGFFGVAPGGMFKATHPSAWAFPESSTAGRAWIGAGKHYDAGRGRVARCLSKREPGQALKAEVAALPGFPLYSMVLDQLGLFTDINPKDEDQARMRSGIGVGHRGSTWAFAIVFSAGGRHFADFPNWNTDIAAAARESIANPPKEGEHDYWRRDFDFKGDPVDWRPPPGWTWSNRSELELARAEARARNQQAAA